MTSLRNTALVLTAVLAATTSIAQMDLYALVEDTSGDRVLMRMAPDDPAGAVEIGPVGADLRWMDYDPVSNWLVAASPTVLYHVDIVTGVATAFPQQPSDDIQGIAFVPPAGKTYVVTDMQPSRGQTQLASVNLDGSLNHEADLSAQVADLDEMMWDPVRGKLYAVAAQDYAMYSIDYDSGTITDTLTITQDSQGRCSVNPLNGLIYEGDFASGGTWVRPILETRDPVTGNRLNTLGQIAGADELWGLAFVPEPSTSLLLLVIAPLLRRRR